MRFAAGSPLFCASTKKDWDGNKVDFVSGCDVMCMMYF